MSRPTNRIATASIASLLFALCSAGCNADAPEPGETPVFNGLLPTMGQEADAEPILAPALCDWAHSVDAIVVGTISSLRMNAAPAIDVYGAGVNDWRWTKSCDHGVEEALAIELNVEQALVGDASGKIVVYVGRDHRIMWNPMPVAGKAGAIEWIVTVDNNLGAPLKVGDTLGFAVHAIDGVDDQGRATGASQWSLMGEALFTVNEEGKVSTQRRAGEVVEPPAQNLEGLPLHSLKQQLQACGGDASEAAAARRERVHTTWGPEGRKPTFYRSAWCIETDAGDAAQCKDDTDCNPVHTCVESKCMPG